MDRGGRLTRFNKKFAGFVKSVSAVSCFNSNGSARSEGRLLLRARVQRRAETAALPLASISCIH